MAKKIVNDFTSGPILKSLIVFSLPFMASNAMQVLYNFVDMLVVGKFVGSYGLSAVSVAGQVFTFVTMIGTGFSTGGQVYISQLVGKKDYEELNSTIGTVFTVLFCMGLIMSVLCLAFKNGILGLLNTPNESYQYAMDYLFVCGFGVVFSYGYNLVSAILRGMGDSRHPFYFIMIASLINVVLDLLFVGVFHMEVAGAALATILGQAFSFLVAIYYLYQHKQDFYFDFKRESFRINKLVFEKLCRLGIPFALQSGAINISMLFVNGLVNSAGVYASATYGVGLKIDDIINKVTVGITYAASAMIGQNFAAEKYDRVKSIVYQAMILSLILYVGFATIFVTQTKFLFSLFTSDIEVLNLAGTFVSAIIVSFPAMVIMRGAGAFLQGIGHAKLSLVFALLDGFVFRICLGYLFGIVLDMGFFGFVLGYALAPYGTSVPQFLYFKFASWQDKKYI